MAMNVSQPEFEFDPYERPLRWSNTSTIDLDRVALEYDNATDTLFVDFFGEPLPGVNVPLDTGDIGFISARLSTATREVVGIEIEGFLRYAIDRLPGWRVLAEFVGLGSVADDTSSNRRSKQVRRIAIAAVIQQSSSFSPT